MRSACHTTVVNSGLCPPNSPLIAARAAAWIVVAFVPVDRGSGIAVGTALTGGPPRRSQRALLTHWAPALGTNAKAHVGKRMHNTGRR
jgi:hypothetical protein